MGRLGKELIESMQQAARHAAGRKGSVNGFKLHRRGFATAELSDEQARTIESSRMGERDANK
jgi:hypothetical protein